VIIVTQRRIGVITFPIARAGVEPLSNLINILLKQSDNLLYVITGNDGSKIANIDTRIQSVNIYHQLKQSLFGRAISYAITQIRISMSVYLMAKNVDSWLFFIGGESLVLPIISAKITQKPAILLFAGSDLKSLESGNGGIIAIFRLFSEINRILADKLIVYSSLLISEWNLEKYRHKILIAHEHFLDFTTFTITTPLPDRPPLLGYIGRLTEEKGARNFALALLLLLGNREDLRVLIGGDGELREAISASLREGGVAARVDLPGWVSRDDLPRYLNQLRLLVLPSYTEGLPNIMLEAMACGTPVLATAVGAVPDVIVDGITGFIMENNSPECIAENVIRALDSPDLDLIAKSGKQFVEENFSFESTVARWEEVLRVM